MVVFRVGLLLFTVVGFSFVGLWCVCVGGFSWWFAHSWLWICLALLGLFGLCMLFTVEAMIPAVGGLIWLCCWC